MKISISPEALRIMTDKQKETLLKLQNNYNAMEVFTAFELPQGYVAFLMWAGQKTEGKTPIYGGINPEGVAST